MRTSPRTLPLVQAHRQRGFRFEVLRYGPADGFVPEPVDLRVLATPRDAIRVLRVQLRSSHVLGLTPHEAGRALHFSEQGGWVSALGALHRGEACGFTLMLRKGRHIEWHVRPSSTSASTPRLRPADRTTRCRGTSRTPRQPPRPCRERQCSGQQRFTGCLYPAGRVRCECASRKYSVRPA
ncbi:hypothetical protein SCALM49S_08412 [Streptomyces californicus]